MPSDRQGSIEIKWGGISPSELDIALAASGATLATDALDDIGLPQTNSKKMFICMNPVPDSNVAAMTVDASTFRLYAGKTNGSWRLPAFRDIVRHICHERIHTDRFWYFRRDNEVNHSLDERIVHEGLATYGEQVAVKHLLTPVEFAGVYSASVPDSLLQSLRDDYLRDNEALMRKRQNNPNDYMTYAAEVLTKWHERAGQTRNTRVGLLGMATVSNLVEAGESLWSLIKTPSQQLITNGMAVHEAEA